MNDENINMDDINEKIEVIDSELEINNKNKDKIKIKVKIVLSGGGVKCSYQLGFIKELLSNEKFNEKYYIDQINGTSSGALIGAYVSTGQIDIAINILKSIKSKDDICSNWSSSPLIGTYLSLYLGIQNKGLFNPVNSYKLTKDINTEILERDINKNIVGLNNFNCTVINVNNGKSQYINGSNPKIKDYINASQALWVLLPPVKIDDCEYVDGALYEQFPLGNNEINNCVNSDKLKDLLDSYDGKILILGTTNIINKNETFSSGSTLFEYLYRLLDIVTSKSLYEENINLINGKNIDSYFLKDNIFINALDISVDKINQALEQGKKDAEDYLLKLEL